jgi:hypothetical protein
MIVCIACSWHCYFSMTITSTKLSWDLIKIEYKLMVFEGIKTVVLVERKHVSLSQHAAMLVTPSQCALQESGRGFNRYKKKGSSGTKRGAAQVKTETAAKRGTAQVKTETAAKRGTSRAKRKR